jgi:hypothetical protein
MSRARIRNGWIIDSHKNEVKITPPFLKLTRWSEINLHFLFGVCPKTGGLSLLSDHLFFRQELKRKQ